MQMPSITETLQHTTCFIQTVSNGGSGSGTGFHFNLYTFENEKFFPCIITNKHVIDGATEIRIDLTKANSDGTPIFGQRVTFVSKSEDWVRHPDPEIDLAALSVGAQITKADATGETPYLQFLDETLIASEHDLSDMDAVENILMIGYPIGVYDAVNNLPVTRSGITASRVGLRYNGRREFLIDCACFPGSSGSPVFQYDSGPRPVRGGGISLGGLRLKFLGVLWGGPTHTEAGKIISVPIQTSAQPIPIVKQMTNLGFCVRAEAVLDFRPLFPQVAAAIRGNTWSVSQTKIL